MVQDVSACVNVKIYTRSQLLAMFFSFSGSNQIACPRAWQRSNAPLRGNENWSIPAPCPYFPLPFPSLTLIGELDTDDFVYCEVQLPSFGLHITHTTDHILHNHAGIKLMNTVKDNSLFVLWDTGFGLCQNLGFLEKIPRKGVGRPNSINRMVRLIKRFSATGAQLKTQVVN